MKSHPLVPTALFSGRPSQALRGPTLACLLAGFLWAQTPAAPVPAALRFLEGTRTGVLVVLGAKDQPLSLGVRKALEDPEGAELELGLLHLDPARQGPRIAALRKALPGFPASGWVLLTPSGTVAGRGQDAPTGAALAAALDSAGARPPIQVLQAFIRTHPGHLEARGDLLRLLRRAAVSRTVAKLGLALPEPGTSEGGTADPAPFHRRLGDREDLEIWSAYAQALNQAFQDGSWLGMELGLGPGDPPVEACSPTVQALYARHLGKVEEALTALPDSASLWQVWLRMSGVAGKHRGRSLVRGLTVPPPELGMEWPPQAVVAALARDARASGDWGMLRELLQPFWERWKARVDREKGRAKDAPPGPPVDWSTGLGPLLEAFLRGASEGEATELAQSLAALPEARPLLERAVALASACGRQDLARRWSAFRR